VLWSEGEGSKFWLVYRFLLSFWLLYIRSQEEKEYVAYFICTALLAFKFWEEKRPRPSVFFTWFILRIKAIYYRYNFTKHKLSKGFCLSRLGRYKYGMCFHENVDGTFLLGKGSSFSVIFLFGFFFVFVFRMRFYELTFWGFTIEQEDEDFVYLMFSLRR